MSRRERTITAGIEAIVGATLALIGFVMESSAILAIVGFVLIVLGGLGVAHSVLLGVGLVSLPTSDDVEDRDDD